MKRVQTFNEQDGLISARVVEQEQEGEVYSLSSHRKAKRTSLAQRMK